MRPSSRRLLYGIALAALPIGPRPAVAEIDAAEFAGLELRNIGPAQKSGRIADVVKDPHDRATWYVGVASGGVWKTVNAGTTWEPIFDDYATYSIGALALDPSNSSILWVGTGENNSQRSVGWGDGVYKSLDGGESFTRVGLERSEHIGKIVIDPRDSDVVWVAAQGPLWSAGGDRGLYRTADGGATWERSLFVSDDTGISDIALDPRDPDILYAASYQRRRHQCCLVAGGPESAIFKSTDGGETWRRLESGLPESDRGRIGLALSPQNPDVLYATIPAVGDEGGFFRSTDRGETWTKVNDYVPVDPQYYQEIFPDPHRYDRLYVMDVWIHVSDDGGNTFERLNSRFKHVDNHAMVFDPEDPDYLMVGTDGGLYESWDLGERWKYVANLPITQFYRVGVDNAEPFYNVYGGTQDNDSTGGPSRTRSVHGIRNSDWIITVEGDGYQTRVDPENPDILYAMWQYGGLVRYDRGSGERVDIQPQPEPDEAPLKWHWDSPLIVSPHAPSRIYFAANRLFRSDDRGDSWQAVSPDLTRQIDRNRLEIMGTVWSVDAVWKNVFTSFYGHIVSLAESPLSEGLLYVGTDDGLVQVSSDGGTNWRRVESVEGVPQLAYVSDLTASSHAANRVYASFNNHKDGDFRPYLLVSDDRGGSWTSIAGDLPDEDAVWTVVEDPVDPNLLFVGTEFGLYFSRDRGGRWIRLEGGMPTIAIRDLEIQPRENDLVAASFGRGFFILDDYSPLRTATAEVLGRDGWLFPVRDTWMYLQTQELGSLEKAVQGDAFFTAPNPPYGALFTYHLAAPVESRKEARQRREAELRERGEPVYYPEWEELRAEDTEVAPTVELVVRDSEGQVVRRISGPTEEGFHRVAWDLRYPSAAPVLSLEDEDRAPWDRPPAGPLAAPGRYSVELVRIVDGETVVAGEAHQFEAKALGLSSLGPVDRNRLLEFQRQVASLQRAVMGTDELAQRRIEQTDLLREALRNSAAGSGELGDRLHEIRSRLLELRTRLTGDRTVAQRSEPTLPGIVARVERVVGAFWSSSAPTETHRRSYDIAAEEFAAVLEDFRGLEADFRRLQADLEVAGVPWTPGRGLPDWPHG